MRKDEGLSCFCYAETQIDDSFATFLSWTNGEESEKHIYEDGNPNKMRRVIEDDSDYWTDNSDSEQLSEIESDQPSESE